MVVGTMAPTDGKKLSRCGRGVLKLTSFAPCPRPGDFKRRQDSEPIAKNLPRNNQPVKTVPNGVSRDIRKDVPKLSVQNPTQPQHPEQEGNVTQQQDSTGPEKDLQVVLAKFSYKANPDEPGGFKELTIKQKEKLYVHFKHKDNPHWVKAENFSGEIGFVPADYLMELKTKPTQLPWLENKQLEMQAEKKTKPSDKDVGFGVPSAGSVKQQPAKAYVSAYDAKGAAQQSASPYNCDLCGKDFNGPLPYRMHMSSKAHREEVEYQNSIR